MLAKKNRLNLALTKNSAIFIRGNSQFVVSDFFLAYLRKNEQELLVACLTPKAVFAQAAKRNYYRRLLYSFVEREIAEGTLSLEMKLDLVIVLKKNFNEKVTEDELKEDFAELMAKIKNEQKE